MKLKKTLQDLIRVIAEEAERNPEFARRIEETIGLEPCAPKIQSPRAAKRRAPPILDPVDLARQGEAALRARLAELTLDQLKDIVADYGMDPGKLVMKWKTPDRVVERIIEVSMGRAKKGEAFLA
jgi:hypothetical protein